MLTQKQLTMISVNAIAVKMMLTYPRVLIVMCGNAAWINVLYCTALAVLLFGAIRAVYSTDKNIIDAAESVGGKALRIIVCLIVFAVMSINVISLIRVFPEIIKLVLLQNTYEEVIGIVFIAALVLGAMCGIESIGRVHEIFIPIAGIIFVIFILLLIPGFNVESVMPILGKGAFNIFVDGISGLSVFSDIFLLNMLISHTRSLDNYKRAGTKSIIIGGTVAFLITAAYCLSYVYPASENLLIPVYQLERMIYLSNFFSRFEAVFQFIWTISILLYGSVYLAVLTEVWEKGFKISKSRIVLLSIAIVLIGAAAFPPSLGDAAAWENTVTRWTYIPVFLLPIIIGCADRIKKKK